MKKFINVLTGSNHQARVFNGVLQPVMVLSGLEVTATSAPDKTMTLNPKLAVIKFGCWF